MDRDDILIYASIFLFVFFAWSISSWIKSGITSFATSDTSETTASVTVNEFISITLTNGFPIAFSSLNPGTTNSSATTNPSNITIGAETNVAFNISYNATSGFYSPSLDETIGAGNMSLATRNKTQTSMQLDTEILGYENQPCPCGSSVMNQTWFYLDVPAGVKAAGDYELNLTIKASG